MTIVLLTESINKLPGAVKQHYKFEKKQNQKQQNKP